SGGERGAVGNRAFRSPSPQPSPLGRGSPSRRSFEIRGPPAWSPRPGCSVEREHARRSAFVFPKSDKRFPLSLGESAGVRGRKPFDGHRYSLCLDLQTSFFSIILMRRAIVRYAARAFFRFNGSTVHFE